MKTESFRWRWWIPVPAPRELELRFEDNDYWAGRKPIKISPTRFKVRLPYVPHEADILTRQKALQAYLQKAKARKQMGRPA